VWNLLARMPLGLLHVPARLLARMAMHVVRYRRRLVEENLELAFPALAAGERRKLAASFHRNIADTTVSAVVRGVASRKMSPC